MELVKTRVQLQTETAAASPTSLSTASSSTSTITASKSYESPLDCLRKIYTTEGWKGLFRGQLITLTRDVPALASYFFTYEYLSQKWSIDGYVSAPVILAAGGMAGITSWVLTYPIDVVKSRLQADGVGGINKYKGVVHCVKSGIASEGVGFLSRGLLSTIIRAFPVNATTFAVVTWTQRLFEEEENCYQNSDTWKEALLVGENLMAAAKVPLPVLLNFRKPVTLEACISLLPQVKAASLSGNLESSTRDWQCKCMQGQISAAIMNKLPEVFSCCISSENNSESQAQNGIWITNSDQILSYSPLSTLTRRHHNLSNAL